MTDVRAREVQRRASVIADLVPGDEVFFRNVNWPPGTAITGVVYKGQQGEPMVGGHPIMTMNICGTLAEFGVTSRAPRPVYVNHPRDRFVPGDVVRDADSDDDRTTWTRNVDGFMNEWRINTANVYVTHDELPDRLRLLVDGETGQVVGS